MNAPSDGDNIGSVLLIQGGIATIGDVDVGIIPYGGIPFQCVCIKIVQAHLCKGHGDCIRMCWIVQCSIFISVTVFYRSSGSAVTNITSGLISFNYAAKGQTVANGCGGTVIRGDQTASAVFISACNDFIITICGNTGI